MDDDRTFTARAIALAERGRSTVRPNPAVGCVLVRDGQIVGEGWHERPGSPHAEVAALAAAGDRAPGATAHVSLEPCDHEGRTGPCTRALLDAGVARVVFAAADPSQDGGETLRQAGVPVTAQVLGDWAEAQARQFLRLAADGRPAVTLKLAQTRDGRLTAPGRRWLTADAARAVVHSYRARHDAVLVGSGTVLADDPRLDARAVEVPAGQPRPIVLDARGRTPASAAVVERGALVFTTQAASQPWRGRLRAAGAEIVEVGAARDGGVSLPIVLGLLGQRGMQAVFVEGGGRVAASLVSAGLVDRLVLHVATDLVAADAVPRWPREVQPPPGAPWAWRTAARGRVGPDLEIVALRDGGR